MNIPPAAPPPVEASPVPPPPVAGPPAAWPPAATARVEASALLAEGKYTPTQAIRYEDPLAAGKPASPPGPAAAVPAASAPTVTLRLDRRLLTGLLALVLVAAALGGIGWALSRGGSTGNEAPTSAALGIGMSPASATPFPQTPTITFSPLPPSQTPTITLSPTPTISPTPDPNFPLPQFELAFASNRDGHWGIYLMDVANARQWLALPYPGDYEYIYWPTFCGPRLAFEVIDQSNNLPRWIYLVNLVQPTDGKVEMFVLPEEIHADRLAEPRCSPKNNFIAYATYRFPKWFFTIQDRRENTIIFETNHPRYNQPSLANWSFDENLLYWTGIQDSGYFDINEVSGITDGSGPISNLVGKGKYAALSPDGKLMAYLGGNLSALYVVEWPSGRKLFERTISYFKQINGEPVPATVAWSPNGKWLYFTSSVTGNWDIYRIRSDGANLQNLTENWPSDELMPAVR